MLTTPNVDVGEALRAVRVEILRRQTGKELAPPRPLMKEQWPPDYDAVLVWRQQTLAKFELNPELIEDAKEFYRTRPVEFICHWCDTYDPRNAQKKKPVWIPLIMFDKQVELVEFIQALLAGQQEGLVEKSRDLGATWVCVGFSVWLWLFHSGTAVGWGSRGEVQVDKIGDPSSIFEKIRLLIMRLPPVFRPEGLSPEQHLNQMKCINPENGSTITGEIGDNIGRGGRTTIYFVDESAHLPRPKKVEAALLENTQVRLHVSSVSGLGTVFHSKRLAGQEWHRGHEIVDDRTNVFIMDWSDHPEKTKEWFDKGKKKAKRNNLYAQFAQEIERNYAASVEGIIILSEWVAASVDAHIVLSKPRTVVFKDEDEIEHTVECPAITGIDSGGDVAALDVADEGGDKNALTKRKGWLFNFAKQWGGIDVGKTARRAIDYCRGHPSLILFYDSIGLGAGIKSETNRLVEDDLMPKGVRVLPWDAGDSVLRPGERVVKNADGSDDEDSPKNGDFYHNLKAQAWWEVARRFERTYKAVVYGEVYRGDELISLSSKMEDLPILKRELSQAVAKKSSSMKLLVDKKPDGATSPNMADSLVMNSCPVLPPDSLTSVDVPMVLS